MNKTIHPRRSLTFTSALLGCLCLAMGSMAVASENPNAADPTVKSAPKDESDTWYVTTRVATEFGTISTHYWSKGPKLRVQTILAGHPVTTIVSGDTYFVYDAILGRGVAIKRSPTAIAEDRGRGRPFGRELDDLLGAGGEKVQDTAEASEANSYEIYQLTNDNGRRRIMMTASLPPLPMRVETFVRSSGKKAVLEYSGWQRALDIEDAFFAPSSNVDLELVPYEDYIRRIGNEPVGPAPVYYRDLLHGNR
ncbi:MAG: hypothetical protein ACI8W3_002987 [Myxococcota bacterium]